MARGKENPTPQRGCLRRKEKGEKEREEPVAQAATGEVSNSSGGAGFGLFSLGPRATRAEKGDRLEQQW